MCGIASSAWSKHSDNTRERSKKGLYHRRKTSVSLIGLIMHAYNLNKT